MKFAPLGFLHTHYSPLHFSSFFSLAAVPSVVLVLAGVWHQPTLEWKHEFDSCHKHALSNSLTMKPFSDPGTVWTPEMENTFSSPFFFLSQGGRGGVVVGHANATLCFFPLSPRGAKARRGTSMRREKGCAECSNRWDESSVLVKYVPLLSSCVPFSHFSHSLLPLLSCVIHFHLSNFFFLSCHIFLSPHLPVSILFLPLAQALFLCLPPFTSLPPFSFMPCSWHVAQNHINTLLPITHTRVQKTERGRERAAKNRLSAVTCPHAEKWAVSSCFPVFLILTTK